MRLDADGVWNIPPDQLAILAAAEQLSSTHDFIPESVLKNKSGPNTSFRDSVWLMVVRKFLTCKEGMYKLSVSGHDCLAINALRKRGLTAMGSPIGIGKESDIYYGEFKGQPVAIKVHRLGRTSFRRVEERNLKNTRNWLTLNIENCRREEELLKRFSTLSVPRILERDRHILIMELINYLPLYKLKPNKPEIIASKMLNFIKEMWNMGYVHGDMNEFNVLADDLNIVVVDFPQCLKKDDKKAKIYLKRDIECVINYFKRKNRYECDLTPIKELLKEIEPDN